MQIHAAMWLAAITTAFALGGCDLKRSGDDDDDGRNNKKGRSLSGPGALSSTELKGKSVAEATSYVVDSGFRPRKDGFSFRNGDYDTRGRRHTYPQDGKGFLDTDGVQRLFGSDNVCMPGPGGCRLTPPAAEWADKVNRHMNGGQCDGMSVAGMALFKGKDKLSAFSKTAKTTAELTREQMRAAIGYYHAYQMTQPFATFWRNKIRRTRPNQTLAELKASMKPGAEPMTLWFWGPRDKHGRQPGHAVLPFAIEDRGNDLFWVHVWDNNFPAVTMAIEFDTAANLWKYDMAAINPAVRVKPWGGPHSIIAVKLEHRMVDAECHVCRKETRRQQLFITGGARAAISDSQGRKLGYQGGKLVNEIPGAEVIQVMGWMPGEPVPEPIYQLPAGADYQVSIDRSEASEQVEVAVFGRGAAFVFGNLGKSATADSLRLASDGFGVSYQAGSDAKPSARLALETSGDDFLIKVAELEAKRDQPLQLRIDPDKLRLTVDRAGTKFTGYPFEVTRHLADGASRVFTNKDVPRGLVQADELDFGNL